MPYSSRYVNVVDISEVMHIVRITWAFVEVGGMSDEHARVTLVWSSRYLISISQIGQCLST